MSTKIVINPLVELINSLVELNKIKEKFVTITPDNSKKGMTQAFQQHAENIATPSTQLSEEKTREGIMTSQKAATMHKLVKTNGAEKGFNI